MTDPVEALCERMELDGIVCIDYETFWSADYTLRKQPTTEYVYDERFKAHMASVQWHTENRAHVLSPDELRDWKAQVDWKRTGLIAHHAHFDGLISSKHFGIVPARYFDTLSMARPIMPVTTGHSLFALCRAFGRVSKKRSSILQETKGVRDLSPAQYRQMALYAGDDAGDCWFLFRKFLPFLSDQELRIIDATVRMYCVPRLLIDGPKVQKLYDSEVTEKAAMLEAVNKQFKRVDITAKTLRSASQFAKLLEALGCDPPMKLSKPTKKHPDGRWIYAFAKNDMEFRALLGDKSQRVRDLARTKLRVTSNLLQTRAARMARRARYGKQPMYLNYCAALTHRWGGSDKINWQNMTRGSELRTAIHAAAGELLIVADSSQIEARLNALFSGQTDKVEQFRKHDRTHDDLDDVYAMTATKIHGRPITKKDNPDERFGGKVMDLSLQYQAGWGRFAHTLRTGAMGKPMDITDALAKSLHAGWRATNPMIVSNWRRTSNLVKQAFISKTRVEDGCVAYEGAGAHGYMHLPNGMSIRYANLEVADDGTVSYLQKVKNGAELRKKLYGGLLVENRTQALSRVLLAAWIDQILLEMPWLQLVMTTHDEVVFAVAKARAAAAHKRIRQIMTTPPDWMPTLPLGVDSMVSRIYEKK